MFLSLFIIIALGILGGLLFEKIRIPKLIWYLLLGILLGPSLLNLVDKSLLNISSYLRQIALIIILTRSGLSLDLKTLKEIGRPAILMCFIPAVFEIAGITIFAPLLLDVTYFEAMLLGSVLAAVSPAVVVPRMIKLKEEGYGKINHTPELIMAGASCDDIFVIVLFYSFKSLVANSSLDAMTFIQIPTSIILGIILGLIVSLLLVLVFKKIKINNTIKCILVLGLSFGMLALEELVKQYVQISSLLGIIVVGMILFKMIPDQAKVIQQKYNSLWSFFEILLFALVGCALDINYAVSSQSLVLIGVILIALAFRSLGVFICILFTKYSIKEKIFIIISYLPKATVQASIGGIALSEGLACGNLILTGAVLSILITAPIGAILMDLLYKKLLTKETSNLTLQ